MADDAKPAEHGSGEVAKLLARIEKLEREKQEADERAKAKAEKDGADALAAAVKKAEAAEETLRVEREARASSDRNRAIFDALRTGSVKDVDGETGKPIRLREDVLGADDFGKVYDLSKLKLDANGKLPASFAASVRDWAKAHPGRFQVGEPAPAGAAGAQQTSSTDGGAVGRTVAGSQQTEVDAARAMARSTWKSLGVLPPDQPAAAK